MSISPVCTVYSVYLQYVLCSGGVCSCVVIAELVLCVYSYTLSLVLVANMWSVLSCSQHWNDLCKVAFSTNWYKTDAKDGITVSRSRFGRGVGRHAVIKIEGFLNHTPETVLQFLQITMKPGGKLDYFFRNEFLVDRIQGSYHTMYVYTCGYAHQLFV